MDVACRIISHLFDILLITQIVEDTQGLVRVPDHRMQIYQVRWPKMRLF